MEGINKRKRDDKFTDDRGVAAQALVALTRLEDVTIKVRRSCLEPLPFDLAHGG